MLTEGEVLDLSGAVMGGNLLDVRISALEEGVFDDGELAALRREWQVRAGQVPVIGITGTGGAGKSSVTDEILNRFLAYFPDMRIAVLAVDPTRRRTGGALLGDRIRMNSLRSERIYMRSIATRRQHLATSEMLADHIACLKSQGFDLVIAVARAELEGTEAGLAPGNGLLAATASAVHWNVLLVVGPGFGPGRMNINNEQQQRT